MKIRSCVLLAGKLALSLGLVAMVFRQVDFAQVVASLAAANPAYAVVCLITALPTLLISAWRWQMLGQGALSFHSALKYILIGMFYGSVLPSAVSGDIARGVALAAKEKSMRIAVLPASILVDRFVGLTALCFLSMVGFVLVQSSAIPGLAEYRSVALSGAVLSAGLVFFLAFPFTLWFDRVIRCVLPWVPFATMRAVIRRVADAVAPYAGMPAVLGRAFGLSLLGHLFTVVGYVFAFRAFDIAVDLLTATIFFSCLSILLLLPVSISGIGVREVFSIFFFSVLDASPEQAVAFSWLLLSLSLVVALIGAGVQVWELYRPSNRLEKNA